MSLSRRMAWTCTALRRYVLFVPIIDTYSHTSRAHQFVTLLDGQPPHFDFTSLTLHYILDLPSPFFPSGSMNPTNRTDSEEEPQTPGEVEELPQDDAADLEKNGDREEDNEKSMTMEERKAKMQRLREKMVRRVALSSLIPFPFKSQPAAVICTCEPCLCD
jgi:hypothetical protein